MKVISHHRLNGVERHRGQPPGQSNYDTGIDNSPPRLRDVVHEDNQQNDAGR